MYGGAREPGSAQTQRLPAQGFFVPPTVLLDPPIASRVWTEEIFGPVLCVRVSLLCNC